MTVAQRHQTEQQNQQQQQQQPQQQQQHQQQLQTHMMATKQQKTANSASGMMYSASVPFPQSQKVRNKLATNLHTHYSVQLAHLCIL